MTVPGKRQALGRGLAALIPAAAASEAEDKAQTKSGTGLRTVDIENIHPSGKQPRKRFDDVRLNELAESIRSQGIIQPLVVRVRPAGGFELVAGERRWRAAKDANLTRIPAIVRSLKELEEVELALIENIQRVDLSPLEQAFSVFKLQQQFNLALDQIAEKLGKAPSTLSNLTRLLQLPDAAKEALRSSSITEGHARAILALKGLEHKQAELLRCILNDRWTVRQAEQFALAVKKGASIAKAAGTTVSQNKLTRQLGTKLNTTVKIKRTAHGGELVIAFKSDNELSKIVSEISSASE